jgi:hypothetical protein
MQSERFSPASTELMNMGYTIPEMEEEC